MPRRNKRKPLGEIGKDDARALLEEAIDVMYPDDDAVEDDPPPAPAPDDDAVEDDPPPAPAPDDDAVEDDPPPAKPRPTPKKPSGGPRLMDTTKVVSEDEKTIQAEWDDVGQPVPAGTI